MLLPRFDTHRCRVSASILPEQSGRVIGLGLRWGVSRHTVLAVCALTYLSRRSSFVTSPVRTRSLRLTFSTDVLMLCVQALGSPAGAYFRKGAVMIGMLAGLGSLVLLILFLVRINKLKNQIQPDDVGR